jgi:hypothetical protein
MKKIIAISVMFALFAGAVFAEVNLGFGLQFKAVIAENDTAKGSVSKSEIGIGDHQVNADFKNDDGTAGGRLRFWGPDNDKAGLGDAPFAFAWWKPIDQLKVQFGRNNDADWSAHNITGWGFTASASSSVAVQYDWDGHGELWKTANVGFYDGFGKAGAAISIYPMDALSIGIGIPLGKDGNFGDTETYNSYPYSHINIKYNLEGLGTLSFSFVGQGGLEKTHHDSEASQGKSVGDLYASFYLTMLEGINIDFGVKFGMPYTESESEVFGITISDKVNPGLAIGLDATYAGDGFGVKLGTGIKLAGSSTASLGSISVTVKEPMQIGVRVLPYYELDICTVYFQFGFGYQAAPNIPGGKAQSDWFINPYIKKSVGNLDFFAGVKLASPDKNNSKNPNTDAHVHYSIPFGFSCGF